MAIDSEDVLRNSVSNSAFEYIDQQSGLDRLTERALRSDCVALDTEANSLHNYYERVCLLQLSMGEMHFVLDPLSDLELSPFLEVLRSKDLIIHGADYDLRLMRSTFDFTPEGEVFDTMLAAQLLGIERFGYAALVEHFFDVKLSKAGQKSNWARRPLTEAQLRYASDDTRYLGPLADLLREELKSQGRAGWHGESCRKMIAATRQSNARDLDGAWRLRGLGQLEGRDLAFVRELWKWREAEAQKADRPPFKIMGNQQLIELAQWASAHADKPVTQGPRLPRHCDGGRLRALESAIRCAERLPKSKWPEKHKRREAPGLRGNDSKRQLEAVRSACAALAHELDIPTSVLAPKATLVSIVRAKACTPEEMKACSGMMDWQVELLKDAIAGVLNK
ncbi:MAG: HRDC domain-containing protein [Candidatus Hydrogenedentes bacterium]|nr:HRDC domain-containing protein [Candidatus Hydrogenedentota bacterium]